MFVMAMQYDCQTPKITDISMLKEEKHDYTNCIKTDSKELED
jgi:hypothetical protein